ncbi:SDR family NAD(P)-dependent oxidoreductase [Paenibacillus thalictri]|uniref:SDR family NAD(P)-dependent oxidoreductase n=1 Tax=Paenibacillus thalictri TaxID=2527873 RepID=A0A4Q9DJB8_9BACL|nr:SDR family NAD(P)-dependent oxidoreductase [Paenibacillus thalictri]TBL73966.1 SDR family NAD(P)-dependent oxidoreductase [Paenibacillus thalictri]
MHKVACVTGADRGLGFELTKLLLKQGYTVFAGRFLSDWDWLDRAVPEYDGRLIPVELDVSDDESVKFAAKLIAGQTDKLDLLINNAGIGGGKDDEIFGDMHFDTMMKLYNVNALGPLRMVNALSGLLLAGEEKLLVNISSEAGQINQTWREGWYGYCMSKAALNVQSNIVHNQLKSKGGRVLVIHPGWMKSYMSGKLNENADISTAESAGHIMNTIRQYLNSGEISQHPAFLDYKGEVMSW